MANVTLAVEDCYRVYNADLTCFGINDKTKISEGITAQGGMSQRCAVASSIAGMGIAIPRLPESFGILSLLYNRIDIDKIATFSENPDSIKNLYNSNKFVPFMYYLDRDVLLKWVNATFTNEELEKASLSGECNFSLYPSEPQTTTSSNLNIGEFIDQNRQTSGNVSHSMSVEELKKVFAR